MAPILVADRPVAAGVASGRRGGGGVRRGGGLFARKRQVVGKTALETIIMLPLVLPPTVVGFLLLAVLGRRSWIGRSIEWLFGQPIVFTWWAAAAAATIVALPLAYQTMKNGFAAVDRELEDAGRSEGAGEWQVFRHITLPLSVRSLLSAFVLGYARALGEFGATLMIAGNIPGKTQTVPTAIYVAVETGETGLAWTWAGAVMLLSFLLLLITGRVRPD